jgi:NAD(P)-dependent dehydrogenase (short-subunit alcohol dehydrogenase family)
MENKVILITGATSGIGKATAFKLAGLGASVILLSRNEEKAEKICDQIRNRINDAKVKFYRADLSSMKEVRSAVEKIKSDFACIDVLINNAGARFDKYYKSDDGIELTFATNYLGHFLLTLSLIEELRKSTQGRIINVSSSAHKGITQKLDDIIAPVNFNAGEIYGRTKLANLYFTYELSGKLRNSRITVNAVDPGFVSTNFARNNGLIPWIKFNTYYLLKRNLVSPQKAAETIVYLASSGKVSEITGRYFLDKKEIKSSPVSYNSETASILWQLSLSLTGIDDFQI